ncbi:carbohydrate porin [Halomonas sp. HP20-15]|uniref:carbohydrate porin n=1 Tax=Halomonas sp. HP20-15 TaxID=3085901 RepID=UPI0029823714|nr:carbohydrate porin [Halomonas sp. HP20-15]MDW5375790.1 carbohydrate porin [Halomonas sp. HP20-15]
MCHVTRLAIAVAALLVGTPTPAALLYEDDDSELTLEGELEWDFDHYTTRSTSLFSREADDRGVESSQYTSLSLDLSGERDRDGRHMAFTLQPYLEDDGYLGFDDVWFALGNDAGLEVRFGRFEAYDLFPLGQDVLVDYGGDTSDDLYIDGEGYVYQVLEGIGPSDSAFQAMISYQGEVLYAEVSTLFGERLTLFDDDTYHGYAIAPHHKEAIIVRPVVAWEPGPWRVAAGLEANLVDDAVVDETGADISARTGYGLTLGYAGEELEINVNLAYMDAYRERDLTMGVNLIWDALGLGYIHARNTIDSVAPAAEEDDIIAGRYTIDTVYASYDLSGLVTVADLETYLGAFYSRIDHDAADDLSDTHSHGLRLQLTYPF